MQKEKKRWLGYFIWERKKNHTIIKKRVRWGRDGRRALCFEGQSADSLFIFSAVDKLVDIRMAWSGTANHLRMIFVKTGLTNTPENITHLH